MKTLLDIFEKSYQKITTFLHKRDKTFMYVAIGDSAVEGIGATNPTRSVPGIIFSTILMSRKNAVYHNLGVNGATISEVLEKQLSQAVAHNPSLITISVGANDIRFGTPTAKFRKELEILIQTLKKETSAEIVINNIPDVSLTPKVPFYAKGISNIMVQRLNKEIVQIAHKEKLIFIDMYHHSRIYGKSYPEIISEDGFHPSDFGYAIWANTIISQISHILNPSKLSLR